MINLDSGVVPIGVMLDYWGATAPDGWLLLDGKTIGDATSGATARSNADAQELFVLLWDNVANAELPIQDSGGTPTARGASAAADFAAHKRLPVPDLRGRAVAGKDDMGGTPAGRLSAWGQTPGKASGEENHTLSAAEMPQHLHGMDSQGSHAHAGSSMGSANTHYYGPPTYGDPVPPGHAKFRDYGDGHWYWPYSTESHGHSTNIAADGLHMHTLVNAGSSTQHNNVQPTIVIYKIIRYK